MTCKFKVGDMVRCIDNVGAPMRFIVGEIYTIRKSWRDSMNGYYLVGVEENGSSMYDFRFELYSKESRKKTGFGAFIEKHAL